MLPVVILAGGLATRLHPLTLTIPKSLIEINGIPFIFHQLSLLKEKGVTEVYLCVGHHSGLIKEKVGDGSELGLKVQYFVDGDKLLGTGGAIKRIIQHLPDTFMVMYGDSYLDLDLDMVVNQYVRDGLPVLMTVFRNRNLFDKSNICMNNGKITRYSKVSSDPDMEYIDYGLMILCRKIFESCPAEKPFDLSVLLSHVVTSGLVTTFEVATRFYEIGSEQGIQETSEYIMNRSINY